MRENPPPFSRVPERAMPRSDAAASRLARMEWSEKTLEECRRFALDAGQTALAGRMDEALRRSALERETLRAWLDAAARWDAAGVRTDFLGDLDPEALARLPESAFREAREKCPGVAVPGRAPETREPATAPKKTPAGPAVPHMPATSPEIPLPAPAPKPDAAPFFTMPVLGPAPKPDAAAPAPHAAPVQAPTAALATPAVPVAAEPARAIPEKPRTARPSPARKAADRARGVLDADLSPAEKLAGRERFHRQAKILAMAVEREYGIPWRVCMAQAVLESGHGESPGARKHNVIFGVKGKGVRMETMEDEGGRKYRTQAEFRTYASVAESFADYARYLTTSKVSSGRLRYAAAFQYAAPVDPRPSWFPKDYDPADHDPEKFLAALGKCGYATDTDYAAKLSRVMRSGFMEA